MNLKPRIENVTELKLIGIPREMSLVHNTTEELWRQFSPRIEEINHRAGNDKISLQVYSLDYFKSFDPTKRFVKWAGVPVTKIELIPNGMEPLVIKKGLHAVFHYKGPSSDNSIFQYIYSEWIHESKYELDDRPHFEVLGDKYINNHPDSEEEIWIPIVLRSLAKDLE